MVVAGAVLQVTTPDRRPDECRFACRRRFVQSPYVCDRPTWHVAVHTEQNFSEHIANPDFNGGLSTFGSCRTGSVSFRHYFAEPSGGVVEIDAVWQGGVYLSREAVEPPLVKRVADEVTLSGCGRKRTVKLRSR